MGSSGPDVLHTLEDIGLLLCVDHVYEAVESTNQPWPGIAIPVSKKSKINILFSMGLQKKSHNIL